MSCAVSDPIQVSCKRGASLVVALEAVGATGAEIGFFALDAGLKEAVGGQYAPPAARPRVATFAVLPRGVAGGIGAGWNLSLTPAQTLALRPGAYVADAVVTLADGSAQQVTEPLVILVEQGVSL